MASRAEPLMAPMGMVEGIKPAAKLPEKTQTVRDKSGPEIRAAETEVMVITRERNNYILDWPLFLASGL